MYVSDPGPATANFWGEISIILLYFTQLFIIFRANKKWENYSQMQPRHNLWNCQLYSKEKLSNKASKSTKSVCSFSMYENEKSHFWMTFHFQSKLLFCFIKWNEFCSMLCKIKTQLHFQNLIFKWFKKQKRINETKENDNPVSLSLYKIVSVFQSTNGHKWSFILAYFIYSPSLIILGQSLNHFNVRTPTINFHCKLYTQETDVHIL